MAAAQRCCRSAAVSPASPSLSRLLRTSLSSGRCCGNSASRAWASASAAPHFLSSRSFFSRFSLASRTSSCSASASDLSFFSASLSLSFAASFGTSTCSTQSSRAGTFHSVPPPTLTAPTSTSPCAPPGALPAGAETNTRTRLPRAIAPPENVLSAPASASCMEVWSGTARSLASVKSTGTTRCVSRSSIALLSCRTSTCMLYLPFGSVSG
mmetsp:Transcript_33285/g.78440  ORF Transcript_33285/g.78440 Transcript_33285/m.78440 type:complete len:211 (+) Transcript_33285:851-1483(+)